MCDSDKNTNKDDFTSQSGICTGNLGTSNNEVLNLVLASMKTLHARMSSLETKLSTLMSVGKNDEVNELSNHLSILKKDLKMSKDFNQPSKSKKTVTKENKIKGVIMAKDKIIDHNLVKNVTKSDICVTNFDSDVLEIAGSNDFIVIQPSSDIFSVKVSSTEECQAVVTQNVSAYVTTAKAMLAEHPNKQVFIGELPPRYDTKEAGEMADLWNSQLAIEAFLVDNLTVISQNGLSCNLGSKRVARFNRDGHNLTLHGIRLLSKNIAYEVKKQIGRTPSRSAP